MKKLLSILSVFTLSASQLLASTFAMSDLSPTEQKYMRDHYGDPFIKYDENTDEIFIDQEFDRELRESGILRTEDVQKVVFCDERRNSKL